MTEEQFASQIDKLIALAREAGLSDHAMIVVLENAGRLLRQGYSMTAQRSEQALMMHWVLD